MTASAAIKTTCPYCGVGCGVIATPQTDGSVTITGDPDHPSNYGRLCSKGSALGETLSLEGRLLQPMVGGKPASWDEALGAVATSFAETIAAYGPDSVALYVSGQITTEDYYVANKLMKGFIGSANIDTNSRLCMASSVAGHRRAFGTDTVPGTYTDLEAADLVVLVGSNLAWCHPVLFQRLAAARAEKGIRVVVIDPRRTATCEIADMHLPVLPGSDVALFNGLLAHLSAVGRIDRAYTASHTSGLADALAVAAELDLAGICRLTGLSARDIADFYELFAATERVVTVYSQGVNQSSAGTDKVNAIINCHLATGRIGKPGMGPFSVTGQPNAMGGREAGGLANMLAAHMELGDPAHRAIVQSFWGSPAIADRPGLKAVELFQAVRAGKVKAIWIMATNPVASLPDADAVAAALDACPFVAVSEVMSETDTTAFAHVLLPSAAWGEKGGTVTNSERRVSRQRAFLSMPGEARPDWWQLAQVAQRMGFSDGFGYEEPGAIFAEYAALTGAGNAGSRDLDISACAGLDAAGYDALEPFQWPWPAGQAEPAGETRFFADGGFYTPDRRGRFVPTPYRAPANSTADGHPLVLNTGRIRDQWHTMTRTGKSARLMAHSPEPFLEIAAGDARATGVADGAIAEVSTAQGRGLYRVRVSDTVAPGQVFVPIHWTGQHASRARTGALVNAVVDPVSGQPEMKHTPASVRPFPAAWHGALMSLSRPAFGAAEYMAIVPLKRGYLAELACRAKDEDGFDAFARTALGVSERDDMLAYYDRGAGQYRFAAFRGGVLAGLLFIGRDPITIARGWAADQLGTTVADGARLKLLAGRPGEGVRDHGPIVCACFEVGRNTIVDAITAKGCTTVAAVGSCCKAGTNCGSCRAEIGKIIDAVSLQKAG